MSIHRTHAIVLGGSLAGLCAAGVLSGFFDKVTVVERDRYPDGPAPRAGVCQGRHAHVLLPAGVLAIEHIFPGFTRRMVQAGALYVDFAMEMAVLGEFGWAPREPTPLKSLMATRDLIDHIVREFARRDPIIEILERVEAKGVSVIAGRGVSRVSGVEVRDRATGHTRTLWVDLVVDASGRGSRVLDWLSEKGFARPDETVVDPLAGCSSRWFQAPPGHRLPGRQWWRGGLIRFARSDRNKVAVLFPVEGDRWIANLTGYGGHFLPSDERSFMAALSNLPSPFIAEAVAHGKPISGVFSHRGTANRMYHYDHWTERLDGFIAIGDAACVFNPVYGQGMSSAAVCATILGQEMRLYGPHSVDLPRHFFKAQAEWLALPWALATRADLGFPTTLGRRPSSGKILEWYMKEAVLTANEDARVRALYNQILTLVTPVSALFSPPIAARVLWSRVLRRLDGATGDPPPSRMPPGPPSLPR